MGRPDFASLPPLAWLLAALAAGVVAQEAWTGAAPSGMLQPAAWLLLGAALTALGMAAALRGRAWPSTLILLAAAAVVGFVYAGARAALPADAVARLAAGPPEYPARAVRLTGVVVTPPDGSVPRRYRLRVERAEGRPASGLLLVTEAEGQQAHPAPTAGQRLEIYGRLAQPRPPGNPGEFDYAGYLRHQGVQAILLADSVRLLGAGPLPLRWLGWFGSLRHRLEAVLKGALPGPEAALLAGLLFGTRGELSAQVVEDFRRTGIFHILAVSGSNVAFVAMPVLALLGAFLGRRPALLGTALVIGGYVLLTGAGLSVMRAGLMALLALAGEALGRPGGGLPALSAAGLALLLANPGNLWDPGFQLSFAATAGILLVSHSLRLQFDRLPVWRRLPAFVRASLAVTLAAQVAVLPLSLAYWGGLSMVAPLANLVAAPMVEGLVLLGSAMVSLGLLSPALARVFAWPVLLLVRALTGATSILADVPLAYLQTPTLRTWEVAGIGLAAALLFAPRRFRHGPRLVAGLLAGLLLLRLVPPPPRLEVAFLDVGQGDAILVRFPGGRVMLVDGGGYQEGQQPGGWDPGEQVVVPYLRRLGVRRVDILVATHPHADHVAGLAAVLLAFPVGELWHSGQENGSAAYQSLLSLARQRKTPLRRVQRGERAMLDGAEVVVLGPPAQLYQGQRSDENANGVVLGLQYGQARLVLAADIEVQQEEDLLEEGGLLPETGLVALKVGHHGSRYASSEGWLRRLGPRLAVVSVGAVNPFGHPSEETLARLEGSGTQVLRTDWDGAVLLRTDGRAVEVRTVRSRRRLRYDLSVSSGGRR